MDATEFAAQLAVSIKWADEISPGEHTPEQARVISTLLSLHREVEANGVPEFLQPKGYKANTMVLKERTIMKEVFSGDEYCIVQKGDHTIPLNIVKLSVVATQTMLHDSVPYDLRWGGINVAATAELVMPLPEDYDYGTIHNLQILDTNGNLLVDLIDAIIIDYTSCNIVLVAHKVVDHRKEGNSGN